eukprot:TRINITY_DN7075_c0_g1_i1.p1 TRINITY_DN7075_c0_g1~~TRINITY_DN7075_c0_g1_i1.p1  ORF type:complete len:440 (-),score=124.85 TRINITY_DN7075_c0_g1_i1:805-2100(-)
MSGFNSERYVALLTKLIGEAEHVQNRPPHNVPKESLVGAHVLEALKPFTKENGGPLEVKVLEFTPGRNNIIITYPGTGDKYVSMVGSHMDVVPANPEEWDFDPFHLTVEGDKLLGRGTTDCLGHVALVTEVFMHLAETKPELAVSVVAVLIANEENSEVADVGVDALVKHGHLGPLKNGWMYWIDCSDSQPCIGTGAAMSWKITANGRKGHSGLPYDAINPLMMSYEAMQVLMSKFHEKYGAHEKEELYNFKSPSTMKPTVWDHPPGSLNQIPGSATISGDIRLTPFHEPDEVMADMEKWVAEINADINALPGRGPMYQYALDNGLKGTIKFEWLDEVYRGIACSLDSPGFKALSKCTEKVLGSLKPYSITGSLPVVWDLQQEGYDLQISGYGLSEVYHGVNEYCLLSGMKTGFSILTGVINELSEVASKM